LALLVGLTMLANAVFRHDAYAQSGPVQGALPPISPPQVQADRSAQSGPAPLTHQIGLQQRDAELVEVNNAANGITLVARDAPTSAVLTALARSQDMNLVLAAPAENRITVALSGRSLSETLDAVLSAGGHTWAMRRGVIYVTALQTGSTVAPELQGREIRIFELDYGSAADVEAAVQGILSPVGQSWISQSSPTDNRRTKEIVTVEDLPGYLARIENYIAQLDQPPRQVLIEAHILEVELSDDNRHGVDFTNLAKSGSLELSFETAGLANMNAPQAFLLQAMAPNLTGVIEALKVTNDAKTLASPRIIAVNGQESRLQVGEQLGFRVTTTTETSTLESVEFLNVGVVLTVTPHIARDGRVLMRIRPEVSSGSVNPQTGLPEEDTTEVQTDVLLSTGQGMIIGGLIRENDTIGANKYLGLGDLPWIGAAFQRRQEVKSRSEIIIALIPHVLPLPSQEQCRNDVEFQRTRDPLLVGELERFPRPYEPRLPDYRVNPPPRPRWAQPYCPPTCRVQSRREPQPVEEIPSAPPNTPHYVLPPVGQHPSPSPTNPYPAEELRRFPPVE